MGNRHSENLSYLQAHSETVRSRPISVLGKSAYFRVVETIEGATVLTHWASGANLYYDFKSSELQRIRYTLPERKSQLTVSYLYGRVGKFELEVFDTTAQVPKQIKAHLRKQFGEQLRDSTSGVFHRVLTGKAQYKKSFWRTTHLWIKLLESSEDSHLVLEVEDKAAVARMDTLRSMRVVDSKSQVVFNSRISAEAVPDTLEHGFYLVQYFVNKHGDVIVLNLPDETSDSLEQHLKHYLNTLKAKPARNCLGEPIQGSTRTKMIAVGNAVRMVGEN